MILFCLLVLFHLNCQCFGVQRISVPVTTPIKLLYNNFRYSYWYGDFRQVYVCPDGTKVTESEKCSTELKPTVTNEQTECPIMNGEHYTVNYEIETLNARSGKKEAIRAEVYSFCFDAEARRSIATWHTITSTQWIDYTDTYNRIIQTQEIGQFQTDLTPLNSAFNAFFKDERISIDFVIPELLVPSGDLDPVQSRGIDLHYFNVAAIWKRKQVLWKKLNEEVWRLVNDKKLLPDIITITTDPYDYEENGFKIKMAKWWYKRVTTSNFDIYHIYLYNKTYYVGETFDFFCSESVCEEISISPVMYDYIHCCKIENPREFP